MIKEAILGHPEEARSGLSRPTIKKFIHKKYPATSKLPEASFNNHISKAIAKGHEKKTFALPKGPSGKVKLAAEAKKAPAKKPAAKKATTTKKPAAKKVKKTTTAKKVSSNGLSTYIQHLLTIMFHYLSLLPRRPSPALRRRPRSPLPRRLRQRRCVNVHGYFFEFLHGCSNF